MSKRVETPVQTAHELAWPALDGALALALGAAFSQSRRGELAPIRMPGVLDIRPRRRRTVIGQGISTLPSFAWLAVFAWPISWHTPSATSSAERTASSAGSPPSGLSERLFENSSVSYFPFGTEPLASRSRGAMSFMPLATSPRLSRAVSGERTLKGPMPSPLHPTAARAPHGSHPRAEKQTYPKDETSNPSAPPLRHLDRQHSHIIVQQDAPRGSTSTDRDTPNPWPPSNSVPHVHAELRLTTPILRGAPSMPEMPSSRKGMPATWRGLEGSQRRTPTLPGSGPHHSPGKDSSPVPGPEATRPQEHGLRESLRLPERLSHSHLVPRETGDLPEPHLGSADRSRLVRPTATRLTGNPATPVAPRIAAPPRPPLLLTPLAVAPRARPNSRAAALIAQAPMVNRTASLSFVKAFDVIERPTQRAPGRSTEASDDSDKIDGFALPWETDRSRLAARRLGPELGTAMQALAISPPPMLHALRDVSSTVRELVEHEVKKQVKRAAESVSRDTQPQITREALSVEALSENFLRGLMTRLNAVAQRDRFRNGLLR